MAVDTGRGGLGGRMMMMGGNVKNFGRMALRAQGIARGS